MSKSGHVFYKPSDFTPEELETNAIAKLVVEGGLQVCKSCGAAESDLQFFTTCGTYLKWKTRNVQYTQRRADRKQVYIENLEEIDLMLQMLRDDIDYPQGVKQRCIDKLESSRASVLEKQKELESLPDDLSKIGYR